MLKDMEKVGECIECGKILTMLIGDTLLPVTNPQYAAELDKQPDFRIHSSLEESCSLCGSWKKPSNAVLKT